MTCPGRRWRMVRTTWQDARLVGDHPSRFGHDRRLQPCQRPFLLVCVSSRWGVGGSGVAAGLPLVASCRRAVRSSIRLDDVMDACGRGPERAVSMPYVELAASRARQYLLVGGAQSVSSEVPAVPLRL